MHEETLLQKKFLHEGIFLHEETFVRRIFFKRGVTFGQKLKSKIINEYKKKNNK